MIETKLNTTGLKEPVESESSAVIGTCFIVLVGIEAGFILTLDAISLAIHFHLFDNQVGVYTV